MGIVGNFLAGEAGNIGSWIDKNIFGGSGATGQKIGSASSGLLRLLPFEQGGYVMTAPTSRAPLNIKVPLMEKGGKTMKKTMRKTKKKSNK